jgi:hypothetical protein
MKEGLALIHKIWSDLKEKEYCKCREGEMENGNKIGMGSSWMK